MTDRELSAAVKRYRALDSDVTGRGDRAESAYRERQRLREAVCAALEARGGEFEDRQHLVILSDAVGWFAAFPRGDRDFDPGKSGGRFDPKGQLARLRAWNRERRQGRGKPSKQSA